MCTIMSIISNFKAHRFQEKLREKYPRYIHREHFESSEVQVVVSYSIYDISIPRGKFSKLGIFVIMSVS